MGDIIVSGQWLSRVIGVTQEQSYSVQEEQTSSVVSGAKAVQSRVVEGADRD